jgi:hypothetical protein
MSNNVFGDIKDKRLIVAKGILFCFLGLLAIVFNLLVDNIYLRLFTALISIWAFCRFYYFLFYALERYVNPGLKYSGLFAIITSLFKKRQQL